ncbi:MAG: hypothetical protein IJ311_00300 [Elusimicrobiaceae bacterium]|nr:hypothetical protein [Elusimicrobiaceae bacterium]
MKKVFLLAIYFLLLTACYAPLNNSGVATTKPWLDIPAKKTDFDGKQFDSCYQFRLNFSPAQAKEALDGQITCIDRCCWRSEQKEVVLDFNKDFEKNLKYYGRAEKYTPAKITLSVSHSNLVNTTSVKVSPQGAIKNNGLVKLKTQTVEDPVRLAQIESQARFLQARHNADLADRAAQQEETSPQSPDPAAIQRAQDLLQRLEGAKIDRYFYKLNKEYKNKGYIFLLSQRIFSAKETAANTYRVFCKAKVQSGTQAENLQSRTVSCGIWQVNLASATASPVDGVARKIKTQN